MIHSSKYQRVGNAALVVTVLFGFYLVGVRQSATAVDRVTADRNLANAISLQKAFVEAANRVEPAVVSILVHQTIERVPVDRFGFPLRRAPRERQQLEIGEGSGFFIRSDGYVLTNYHVVQEGDTMKVRTHDGSEYAARVVGTDRVLDLAVLKVDGKRKWPTVSLGNSDDVQVGQWAIAVGNPFRLSNTVTVGVISAKGREPDFLSGTVGAQDYIQTDASINPGNSGGPLVNVFGEVVGVNNAIYSPSGGNVGIGFAIPINHVKPVLDDLIAGRAIKRGWLGVSVLDMTPELARRVGLPFHEGCLVAQVAPNSPAARAGIARGDIIIRVNGKPMPNGKVLQRSILSLPVGRTVAVEVLRDGREQTLKVRLGDLSAA